MQDKTFEHPYLQAIKSHTWVSRLYFNQVEITLPS